MEKYNGWTNYETWLVNLWMSNDYGDYLHWGERAKEVFSVSTPQSPFSRLERAALDLADEMRSRHEEEVDAIMPNNVGLYFDLLNGAMKEVNWYEIAKAWIQAENDIDEDGEDLQPDKNGEKPSSCPAGVS